MIKVFSKKNIDKSSVIELWQECFGDSREYIEFFLDNCPTYSCVCYLIDNKIVSMLFLLNGFLNKQKCMYLYAACTSNKFRRQGIMENLIEFSKEYASEHDAAGIFLVPANESLYSYYSKFGFLASFKKQETVINFVECKNNRLSDQFTYDEIVSLKKFLCSKFDSFLFDDETIKYTIMEHLFNDGKIFFDSDSKSVVFYYENENNVIIKEILTEAASVETVINEGFVNNSGKNIYIFSPIVYNNKDIVVNYTKCGMCYPIDEKLKAYLAHNCEIYAGMYLD